MTIAATTIAASVAAIAAVATSAAAAAPAVSALTHAQTQFAHTQTHTHTQFARFAHVNASNSKLLLLPSENQVELAEAAASATTIA